MVQEVSFIVEYFSVFIIDGYQEIEDDSFYCTRFDTREEALANYKEYKITGNVNSKSFYKHCFRYSKYGDYDHIEDEFYTKADVRGKRIKKIINGF